MITVFGSANLDLIGKVGRLPRPGETVPGSTFAMAAGGKGANQALAARRAGAVVKLVCAVGEDTFAAEALRLLRADGVDLGALRTVGTATGIAMILVDDHGENVIAILPGANGTLVPSDADAAFGELPHGSIIVLQQEIPEAANERALDWARERGLVAILNTAPFLPTTPVLAQKAGIVVANETEFALLCGGATGSLEGPMANWAKRHGQTMIVTLGSEGARAATPEAFFSVSALPISPLDTVGAGDTFVGYLAAGLDAGMPLEDSMRRAAVAASLACLKPGAQPAIPYAGEVAEALPAAP
jgi:ribokinase